MLVGTARAAAALADDLGPFGQDLIDEFWPGALTLIFRASPTLLWDLGETNGTVALRMPLHPVALDLLKQTGPLAVSSANRTGRPAADHRGRGAGAARRGGRGLSGRRPVHRQRPLTILDLTGRSPRLLRAGAVSVDRLRTVVSVVADETTGSPRRPAPGLQARVAASDGGRAGPGRRAGRRPPPAG